MLLGPEITVNDDHRYIDSEGQELGPSVTRVLKGVGLISERGDETAMLRDQAVHLAIQYYEEGRLHLLSVGEAIHPYFEAYLSFVKDTGFKANAIEQKVFDQGYGYCGTLDLAGRAEIAVKPWLLDTKTGTSPKSAGLHTAAYGACLDSPHDRFSLELHNDGTYRFLPHRDPNDIKVFRAALAVYNWRKTMDYNDQEVQKRALSLKQLASELVIENQDRFRGAV